MKKLSLSFLVVMCISYASFAQNNPVKFGVKAGVAFPNLSISSDGMSMSFKTKTSFYVGAIADIPVSDIFSVQPGLTYISKGSKGDSYDITMGSTNSVQVSESSVNINYIEIPVNLLANFDINNAGKVFIGAGPYYAFGLSANSKDGSVKEDIKFGSGVEEMKRGDYGVNFLGGFRVNNGFDIHVGYGLGLGNLTNESGAKIKNKVFSVGVGYSF